jgi:hypothetical protein
MIERVRPKRKVASEPVRLRPATSKIFGKPLLLEGEDADGYEELFTQLCAAVKPQDVIDYIFVRDTADLQWDVSRWRRIRSAVMRDRQISGLRVFLSTHLDDEMCRSELADRLVEAIRSTVENGDEQSISQLARRCARGEAEAVEKVNKQLEGTELDFDQIRDDVRLHKSEELGQRYAQGDPETVTLVDEILTCAGTNLDSLLAEELEGKLDYIERLDRLITISENRRNAALREIERRRAALGEALRRGVQEVDRSEIKAITNIQRKGTDAA